MKEIILASFNTHKIHELRQALKQLMPDLQVLSLFDFPAYKRPGVSFEENVGMKALHAAKALQKTCIADDSKIVIPALEKAGAPLAKINIITSSPNEQESLAKQTKKLLEAMRSFTEMQRLAYLECSLAIATPEKVIKTTCGRCEGHLHDEERGKMTFDFDTIFMKHDYSKTLGELPASVRLRISHRRKALEQLLPAIERAVR